MERKEDSRRRRREKFLVSLGAERLYPKRALGTYHFNKEMSSCLKRKQGLSIIT